MIVDITCCLCTNSTELEIELPAGWDCSSVYDSGDAFCPAHAAVAGFMDSQCPGCVGAWGDCPMWGAFAYSDKRRNIGPGDYEAIERGICPRRVNGTFSFSMKDGLDKLDLSETAPSEAGKALADAIREYVQIYPADNK